MAVVNIAQGANKTVQILGLKVMQARIKEIRSAVVSEEAAAIMLEAAQMTADRIRHNAEAVNLPHEALRDIYVYGRQPRSTGRSLSVTALAGLRKAGRNKDAHGYRTWFPGRQRGAFEKSNRTKRKKGSLMLPGTRSRGGSGLQRIGESLATMWEFGTTKMPPRPFFRPAIAAMRGPVLAAMAAGYRGILERHSAK